MPYTNPWSNITPAGADLAGSPGLSKVSAALRRLKLDIAERMTSLVEDWFADPIQAKSNVGSVEYSKRYKYSTFGTDCAGAIVPPAVFAPSVIRSILVLDVIALTDGAGRFVIDFTDPGFAEAWNVGIANLIGTNFGPLWNLSDNDVCFARIVIQTNDSLTFVVEAQNGADRVNTNVRGRLILSFAT